MNFTDSLSTTTPFFKKFVALFIICTFIFALSTHSQAQTQTIVQKYGQLRVQGNRIVDKNGAVTQPRGMSIPSSLINGKIVIANSNGVQVFNGIALQSVQNIDLNRLPAGLYILKISLGNSIATTKIIKK